MLESLEGKRGMVRAKPPIPAIEGLFGKPTVVNNVLTLGPVPDDPGRRRGGLSSSYGVGRSRGTQVFQLGGNIARGGIVETAFGITLGELVEGYGGGTRSGRPVRTVAGRRTARGLPARRRSSTCPWTTRRSPRRRRWSATAVWWSSTTPWTWPRQARFAMEFCAEESCGKCTPCRIGAVRGVEVIDQIVAGERPAREPAAARTTCAT